MYEERQRIKSEAVLYYSESLVDEEEKQQVGRFIFCFVEWKDGPFMEHRERGLELKIPPTHLNYANV